MAEVSDYDDIESVREALAGMVYLYDRLGFNVAVVANTDPTMAFFNIIWQAKRLARLSRFVPPKDLEIA
jgi:ketol-acid reductoisomerase